MSNPFQYITISEHSQAEWKDRGSKFIAIAEHASSAEDCKMILKKIKALHPKANHHCYAYKLIDNSTRTSDDGEPSNSAGKPILRAIESEQLVNIMVVVVRYFGGTLLGVAGLVHAYGTAAKAAMSAAKKEACEPMQNYELEYDYTLNGSINQLCQRYEIKQLSTENLLFCKKEIAVLASQCALVENAMKQIHLLQWKKK